MKLYNDINIRQRKFTKNAEIFFNYKNNKNTGTTEYNYLNLHHVDNIKDTINVLENYIERIELDILTMFLRDNEKNIILKTV